METTMIDNLLETKEFDALLEQNYVIENDSELVEFKHDGTVYVTESVDEDDLEFLQLLNEID